jgi:hypothetical protein
MNVNFKGRTDVASVVGAVIAIAIGYHYDFSAKVTVVFALFISMVVAGFWLVVFEDVLGSKN